MVREVLSPDALLILTVRLQSFICKTLIVPSKSPLLRVTPVVELNALLTLNIVWLLFGLNIFTKFEAAQLC